MRLSALVLTASFTMTIANWSVPAAAQSERDYIFTDDEGHLILRFAGAGHGELDDTQMDEIVNLQLSTMVHDRMRADTLFEAEPVDPAWADPMRARLEQHVGQMLPEISRARVECRSASCRLVLEHSGGFTVAQHQALMKPVERAFRAFIDADPASFERVFLIAAHYKEGGSAYIKVFLTRAPERPPEPRNGS